MRLVFFCFLFVAVIAAPTAETQYGQVVGYAADSGQVNIWRGIPFAAPPVGNLRLKSPEPPATWSSPRQCTAQANICPQVKLSSSFFIGNEDCLYLDVYVPTNAGPGPLPVMVFLFGGGYVFGDGWEFGLYDGTNFAQKYGVVLVTPNYRLGSLGFMALDQLRAESSHNSTGNYALEDQTFALQWVQNNIRNFGGDPTKVTIFGESAGAFSVCWHIASPTSKGLFRAALMESGSCDSIQFFRDYPDAKQWSEEWAFQVGCDPVSSNLLQCLRSLSTDAIIGALLFQNQLNRISATYSASSSSSSSSFDSDSATNLESDEWRQALAVLKNVRPHEILSNSAHVEILRDFVPALYPVMSWGPAIDHTDEDLLNTPLNSIVHGQFNSVPSLFGTNHDEGTIFVPMMYLVVPGIHNPLDYFSVNASLFHFYQNQTLVDKILDMYPLGDYNNSWSLIVSRVLRDDFFVCSTRRAMKALYDAGQTNLWMYQWYYQGDWIEDGILGNYHSGELEYVFNNPWPPIVHTFSQRDMEMSDSFGSYWSQFAKTLSPNGLAQPEWPRWDPTNERHQQLDVPPFPSSFLRYSQCENLWDIVARDTEPQELRARRKRMHDTLTRQCFPKRH